MGRLPRSAFTPSENETGVYLHLFNRLTTDAELGHAEKQYFLNLLKNALSLYSIDCLSAVIMPSYYHLILYVPKKAHPLQEITLTLNGHNESPLDEGYALQRQQNSNKLSHFMNELQRNFTIWYNKTRSKHRSGTLWPNRYQCLKLLDSSALIHCIKYNELAPVRMRLTNTPADYPYSSFGISQKTTLHPFADSFLKHMNIALKQDLSLPELCQAFQDDFLKLLNWKVDTPNEVKLKRLLTRKNRHPLLQTSRLWTDTVALGSKKNLREYAAILWGLERAKKKKFGKVISTKECEIYSMRQLQTNIFS